jgi:hypothetical protein
MQSQEFVGISIYQAFLSWIIPAWLPEKGDRQIESRHDEAQTYTTESPLSWDKRERLKLLFVTVQTCHIELGGMTFTGAIHAAIGRSDFPNQKLPLHDFENFDSFKSLELLAEIIS